MAVWSRLLLIVAGLIGAAGIASAAAASHGDSRNLAAITTVFLAHAPTLLALALLGRGRALQGAGLALALGTAIFGGDLAMREWLSQALFPLAAPLGGAIMILAWLALAGAGAMGWGRSIHKD